MRHLSLITALLICGGCSEGEQQNPSDQPNANATAATSRNAGAGEEGAPADEGQSQEEDGVYTAIVESEEGLEVIRYLKVGTVAVVEWDIDIGDHDDFQQETLRNLASITAALDPQALGVTEADRARLKDLLDQYRASVAKGAQPLGPFGHAVNLPWPNRTLVYEISPSITNAALRQRIADAAAIWNATGLVAVRPKQAGDENIRVAAVISSSEINKDPDKFYCASTQGYVSKNRTTLSNKCETYTIVHEFGHALGVKHEHTRMDRSNLIRLDMSKINKDYKSQYDANSGLYHGTAHDLCSIMHYGPTASSRATTSGKAETWYTLTEAGTKAMAQCAAALKNQGNCGTTVFKKPGQRCALSSVDKAVVSAMYPRR
jgi:hypothetical protein